MYWLLSHATVQYSPLSILAQLLPACVCCLTPPTTHHHCLPAPMCPLARPWVYQRIQGDLWLLHGLTATLLLTEHTWPFASHSRHCAPWSWCLFVSMDSGAYDQQPGTGNQATIKPYPNLANCGLQHSQLSALHSMLPNLSPDTTVLPQGAVNLGDSYILFRAQDESCVTLNRQHATAICMFLASKLRQDKFPTDWEPRYIRWAKPCLPTLQIAHCAWKKKSCTSSADSVCVIFGVLFICDCTISKLSFLFW